MNSHSVRFRIGALLLLFVRCLGLNTDGVLLLSFKYSVLSDPLSALGSWSYYDETPCSWGGVTCGVDGTRLRVISLALPSSRLLGSIPANLGMLEHLRTLDLSNNSLNGSLPASLLNAPELRSLDLSGNLISGEIPAIGGLGNLESLNLSDNAFAGNLPENLTGLRNLAVVSLRNNYFSGNLPNGFDSVQLLDLSSNLLNGSLPPDFGGANIRYFNVSYNRISGRIPPEFAARLPENAAVDLSYNNLTGEVPDSRALRDQETASFSGNPYLCGAPLRNPCPIPHNASEPISPPAIAAFPRPAESTPGAVPPESRAQQGTSRMKTGTIVGIVVGDLAGIALLVLTFLYIFHRKKKVASTEKKGQKQSESDANVDDWSESRGIMACSCLRKRGEEEEEEEEGEESSSSSSGRLEEVKGRERSGREGQENQRRGGSLVTVDGGEKELELENLLRASAYILGASGSSIMYRAVMEDGSAVAVRRIGESGVEKAKDFEAQVRAVAKLVHPNLVRLRGFYWGAEDKLIIYDYVPNGSLANARYRKMGASPCHLPWEARLKIAKGVARGLAYLHDKKHVHGNLKPSNILLDSNMEPKIADFGLEKLVSGDSNTFKLGGSMRNFGSKRSTASRDSFQDQALGPGPSPSPNPSPSPSSIGCASPYHAPESLRSLKPTAKWDAYSFGVVLLEMLTGKFVNVDEVGPGMAAEEERTKVLRAADAAIRADMEGKEDALLACFRLGFNCASQVPQRRPSMKEALQILEKIPSSSCSSSHRYGH